MHLQPLYRQCRIRGGAVSEELFDKGLCLPSGSNLAIEDLTRIVKIIRSTSKHAARGVTASVD
jgi:dTDP-4-amino-4,6-dideoxygalactose transaminase